MRLPGTLAFALAAAGYSFPARIDPAAPATLTTPPGLSAWTLADSIPAQAIRDTLAGIIGSGDYARGVRQTLLARFMSWLGDLWTRLLTMAGDSPMVRWLSIAFLALIVASVIARVAWLWIQERRALRQLERMTGARLVNGEDPLVEARRAADRGDHTVASHLLYRALLVRLSAREKLRLHPAKTAGDYARELHARESVLATPFRRFARAYERAVYGTAAVNSATWNELHELAEPILA